MTRISPAFAIKTPPAPPGARIGLMGGSFNPPHEGHLAMAETALRRGKLDRIWWIVTPGNPLKSRDELRPLSERLAAVRALARHPRMEVTAFEADLGCAYTHETVGYLRGRYPAASFVWVMGGDSLATFHKWRHWREIAASVPLLVIDRPGWRMRALSSPAALALTRARLPEAAVGALSLRKPPAWCYLTNPLSPLSSTEIRRRGR